ncbi:MAG: polysaccharide deacetylase family protein [bacterium]|nr:polysaccharide deacetylase family protein [bacterium]
MLGWVALVGWVGVAGLAAVLSRMYREESRDDRILCLLYHRVIPRSTYDRFTGTEQIFSMPDDRFKEQLVWLRAHGYHFIGLDQLAAHLSTKAPLPDNPVFISFDDGCESVYKHALPILSGLGIPSTVFVTIDEDAWIFHEGEYFERRMTIEEMRSCAEGGIQIGSHAVSHRGLNEMSRERVLDELVRSKKTLSEWIDRKVDHFAVPLNFYKRETLELCKEAGYASVCTSDNGTCNRDTDPFKIKRFIIEGSYDLAAFEHSLSPRVILQRRIINAMKKLPPKILGERIWMPLRQAIFNSPLGPFLTIGRLRMMLLVLAALGGLGLVAITLVALG